MKVVVLAPHPDDEVLGCGGSIARHVARGDEVIVGIVTRGIAEVFDQEWIDRGREEAREAHRLLGVERTEFLDFPAPPLDVTAKHTIVPAISSLLEGVETLYIPHIGDLHSDHQVTHESALVAARPGRSHVRNLYAYETLSETEWGIRPFVPNWFTDITEHLDRKLEAMACYETQLQEPPSPRSLEGVRSLAKYRGSMVARHAAEAFEAVRVIQ